jgi:DNA polymerase-3 subunit epsilon
MIEVLLDIETTGLSVAQNHRIVEIGCIELNEQIPTNKVFHEYINPQRKVSEEAYKVHGYSDKFLADKKKFSEIVEKFLDFIKEKKIIIHNADFDLGFINYELRKIKIKPIDRTNVIDTLEVARKKFPGSQNSLDALCKRYNIDNSKREKHSAIIDCKLLKEVYINLLGQKEPKLNFQNAEIIDHNFYKSKVDKNNFKRKIIEINDEELKLHKKYLSSYLSKNNFK